MNPEIHEKLISSPVWRMNTRFKNWKGRNPMKYRFAILAVVCVAAFFSGRASADTNLARTCFAPNATQYAFSAANDCPADQKGWSVPVADTIVLSTSGGDVTYDNPDSKYRRFADVPAAGMVTACTADIAAGKNASATADACPGANRTSIALASVAVAPTQISSTATLTWGPPANAATVAPAGYNVYQNGVKIGTTIPSVNTFVVTKLQPGTYTFEVAAYIASGEGPHASSSGTVSKPVIIPGTPTNVQVTITVQVPK